MEIWPLPRWANFDPTWTSLEHDLDIIKTNIQTSCNEDLVENIASNQVNYYYNPTWPTFGHDTCIIKIFNLSNFHEQAENMASRIMTYFDEPMWPTFGHGLDVNKTIIITNFYDDLAKNMTFQVTFFSIWPRNQDNHSHPKSWLNLKCGLKSINKVSFDFCQWPSYFFIPVDPYSNMTLNICTTFHVHLMQNKSSGLNNLSLDRQQDVHPAIIIAHLYTLCTGELIRRQNIFELIPPTFYEGNTAIFAHVQIKNWLKSLSINFLKIWEKRKN